MKIDDLEVGTCYHSGYGCEYMCLFKSDKWAVMLYYEDAHYVAHTIFVDQKWLDSFEKFEIVDVWPLSEYLDEFEIVDDSTNTYISNRNY